MKKFKKFMSEEPSQEPSGAYFVKVRNGKAQLCNTEYAGPCMTFGQDIVSAVLQGDIVVVTTSKGLVQTWNLDRDARIVIGPVRSV